MKKLIKADLNKVLELTATYQPIDRDSLKAELEILEQSRYNNYLFLARKDRLRSILPAVMPMGFSLCLKYRPAGRF